MSEGGIKNEKGFVLVLALVTMVAMTLIGVSLVMNMTTDMQLARNEREAKIAFQLAEAGINEAIARLRLPPTITQGADDDPIVTHSARYIGELSTDAGYRTTSWNNNNSVGKNFGFGNTNPDRQSADGLNYSVTINYLSEGNSEGLCDSNEVSPNTSGNSTVPPAACSNTTAEIVMFGQDFNISSSLTGINYGIYPVYQITSTGTSGSTTSTVEAYVGASYFNPDIGVALNTNDCVTVNGATNRIEGPATIGGACNCAVVTAIQTEGTCSNKAASDDMNDYLGVPLSLIKKNADEVHYCTNATCSNPGDDIPASGNIDTVVNNWGDGDTPRIIYIDNAGGKPASLSGIDEGVGVLIVTGDLEISGNVEFEGLVYVLGTVTLNGGGGEELEVEGALMANNVVTMNGSVEVEYEQEVLESLAKTLSTSALISWKRL